ncbi:hypothetical protein ACFQX7_14060 [Luedemannella flava]
MEVFDHVLYPLTVQRMFVDSRQGVAEFGRGEGLREPAQHEIARLVVVAMVGQCGQEKRALVRRGPGHAGDQARSGLVQRESVARPEDSGPESDGGDVALADTTHGHDEPQLPLDETGLVRVGRHRRVEQGGALGRVLVGEAGADEHATFGGQASG